MLCTPKGSLTIMLWLITASVSIIRILLFRLLESCL
jgi:hypothetical protein